jgi:hypothetical protein
MDPITLEEFKNDENEKYLVMKALGLKNNNFYKNKKKDNDEKS